MNFLNFWSSTIVHIIKCILSIPALKRNICEIFPLIYCYVCIAKLKLPTQDKLKTVLDKVKDFFGDAKESFGKITSLGTTTTEESEEDTTEKTKWVLHLIAWRKTLNLYYVGISSYFLIFFYIDLHFMLTFNGVYLILWISLNIIQLTWTW